MANSKKKNISKEIKFEKNILKGDNKRLNNKEPTNNEGTAAWSNDERLEDTTNVNIPSDYSVNKAKNWVDNGSQT